MGDTACTDSTSRPIVPDSPPTSTTQCHPAGLPAEFRVRQSPRDVEAAELSEFLARIAGGDIGSFAEFYDRTCSLVYGTALRVLRDTGFAEETTQEVYLQVWRNAGSFDPARGSALSWLMTLAHARAVDRVRAEQSNTDRHVAYETRNRTGEFDQVTEEVLGRIERRAVQDGLAELTEVQREAVSMAYYGGRTYREVAADLGVALPTIKSRIRDGLIRLRQTLPVG